MALVTGGRRGIGRGIAYELAVAGFDVAVADLELDDDAAETLGGIRERGARGEFVQCDVADVDAHGAVLNAVRESLGPVSSLVNNAGISVERREDLLATTPESFDRLINTNLRGPFFLTQRVAAEFVSGGSRGHYRSIVNISSANAYAASINRAEYCLSKAAINMATHLFAARLGSEGIGVFEVRPGIVRTAMTAVAADDYEKRIAAGLTPMPRWGEPADVGRAVAVLASGALGFSTGEAIHVDGGLHIQRL